MEEKKRLFGSKIKLIVLISVLCILIALYVVLIAYNLFQMKEYENKVFPNVYLESHNIGNCDFNKLEDKINSYNDEASSSKVKIKVNGNEFEYSYSELGLSIDTDGIINSIKKYQSELGYTDKVILLNSKEKKTFNYYLKLDDSILTNFLNTLKSQVDVNLSNGYFNITDGNVNYVEGVNSFYLNVDESLKIVKDNLNSLSKGITLVGEGEQAAYNESYKYIDTKVSSFSTVFNQYQYARVTNLRTALNYINGAIIEPGEIFSYYKYAGPYNKSGYVFYYEFVGNGVCQIATTVYDAALLGGLEIVKRYPHAKKSVYVDGGLDATVASYSSGWNVDFQFKNTYKYPIYISAYMIGNRAYVDFWSNSNAKEGKTYSTESVKIGARGYKTYLHTYKDGVEIDKSFIATTWYTED